MKRIRTLLDPTRGLATYRDECQDGQASWEGFRNHAASSSYRKLVATLATLQRGLCGYCEIDLKESDRQIKHVIPRSDPNRGPSEALNPGNMIACYNDPDVMEFAARSELLPDQNGELPRFFTTSRSYFGLYGERCLKQDTRLWV